MATEAQEEDDDLKLAKASAGLLLDLEEDLPKILWKTKSGRRYAHTLMKSRDLGRILSYIEPFQGEPQLLDAKLKNILPGIVDAYLEYLQQASTKRQRNREGCVDLQTAVCTILYTLCKVRGHKIIVGFFNNEPRYLELVLEAAERTICGEQGKGEDWKVPYILLLWLGHLLLTPFDLHSISSSPGPKISGGEENESLYRELALPPLIKRILRIGISYLHTPTKAQDAAAAMLVRLSTRPDVQKISLAEVLLTSLLPKLTASVNETSNIYNTIGSLRYIAGLASSTELAHLIPRIYRTCAKTFDDDDTSSLSSNAVAKKLLVKIFRNIAVLCLRTTQLQSFAETEGVLENTIDYLLRSLGDKDTPVRYAAAKALSIIVLSLEPEIAHEVIQAILDSFKEDLPRSTGATVDFSTANPLKWHGLTLALSHTLFKRSASTTQLPEILSALISALQFQQRTATGSTLGTNVRDAANFGIWSLARRYTTAELLLVEASSILTQSVITKGRSVIQILATQLILSACLDPAGNIRRGSSAAFQELVGRHPDQVLQGIALVQIVDYQAVSLRGRAMVGVATSAAQTGEIYWRALLDGLLGWRGLGSSDVASRESAARGVAGLASTCFSERGHLREGSVDVLRLVVGSIGFCPIQDVEMLHGLGLVVAHILDEPAWQKHREALRGVLDRSEAALGKEWSPRLLRSEFPASVARFITALCNCRRTGLPWNTIDAIFERLLVRHEEFMLEVVPEMAMAVFRAKRAAHMEVVAPLKELARKIEGDATKSPLNGAGRAIALGALAGDLAKITSGSEEKVRVVIKILSNLLRAQNVEWRIIGARALQLALSGAQGTLQPSGSLAGWTPVNAGLVPSAVALDPDVLDMIFEAVHTGLNDYTIDERGDVGSLVRLRAIECTNAIFCGQFGSVKSTQMLQSDIYRLSLEKLDRVRFAAGIVRGRLMDIGRMQVELGDVSSVAYFKSAIRPLWPVVGWKDWVVRAVVEGCVSCAGSGAGEGILQNSRAVLGEAFRAVGYEEVEGFMTIFVGVLRDADSGNVTPALDLLGFLLDMGIPQRMSGTGVFKWRGLLSTVMKAHHKSNDIPRLLAAVHVYYGLAGVEEVRGEVLKKLVGMLGTNPYPSVRMAVAEALWCVTGEEVLKGVDWGKKRGEKENGVLEELRGRLGLV